MTPTRSSPSDRISSSGLTIRWTVPPLEDERREFSHPAKQDFFQRYGIAWSEIEESFPGGVLVDYPRGPFIAGIPVSQSYSGYDEYLEFVARAKRSYRSNYVALERDLERQGMLTLPAPVILVHSGEGLLFSGYRRLCLAWNHAMVPAVWLVPLG